MKHIKVIFLFFSVALLTNLLSQNREKTNYYNEIEIIKKQLKKETYDEKHLAIKYNLLGHYYNKLNLIDSAYKYMSNSKEISLRISDTINVVNRMYSLAKIEFQKEFFSKSDSTAIKALRLLGKKKNKQNITSSLYNILGTSANIQGNYQEAINCYNNVLKGASDSINVIRYKSNIAFNLIYLKKYPQANTIYRNIKASKFFDSISDYLKGKILDNHAFSRLLNNEEVVESDFLEGQKIKARINDIMGLTANYHYLSEFFQKKENISKSRKYAQMMYDLALKHNMSDSRIAAIDKILSLEPNSRARELSIEKSEILDSIQRKRNEFATTIYNYKDEVNKRIVAESNLSKTNLQKQKWIFAVGVTLILFVVYFFYKRGRTKKEKIIEV